MRYILIDPSQEKIEYVEATTKNGKLNMQHFYETLETESVDAIVLPNGDRMYIDNDGFTREVRYAFQYDLRKLPIVNKAIVVHRNKEARLEQPVSTLAELESKIIFIGRL